MPQLDKFIFFNHVASLVIFFALIYVFIRKSIIPEISTILKYRKQRIVLFQEQLNNYQKMLDFSQSIFEKKGKNFINKIFLKLDKLFNFYKKESTSLLYCLYDRNIYYRAQKYIYNNNILFNSVNELIRIGFINKKQKKELIRFIFTSL